MENRENLQSVVKEIRLDTRLKKDKTGTYKMVVIKLNNDYEIENFLDKAEQKLVELLLPKKQ